MFSSHLKKKKKKDHKLFFTFCSLENSAEYWKTEVPWEIGCMSAYELFLEVDVKTSQDFINFINRNSPNELAAKFSFLKLCETVSLHLEDWQGKEGEYFWIVYLFIEEIEGSPILFE